MNRMLRMDVDDIRQLIHDRLAKHTAFKAVIWVTVDQYPEGFSATVWLGQDPDREMWQYVFQIEEELRGLGVSCNIVLKSDRDLPHGGTYRLSTSRGEFTYRHYRVDPVRDEDWVFVFSLHRGSSVYRVRVSLTRTLASMLRARGTFDDGRLLDEYLTEIKSRLEHERLQPGRIEEIVFDSRDLARFTEG